jgi:hypothetical protein
MTESACAVEVRSLMSERGPEDPDDPCRHLPLWGSVGQDFARPRVGGQKKDGWQGAGAGDGVAPKTSRERSLAAAGERHTDRHFSVTVFGRVCGAERGRCGIENGADCGEQV